MFTLLKLLEGKMSLGPLVPANVLFGRGKGAESSNSGEGERHGVFLVSVFGGQLADYKRSLHRQLLGLSFLRTCLERVSPLESMHLDNLGLQGLSSLICHNNPNTLFSCPTTAFVYGMYFRSCPSSGLKLVTPCPPESFLGHQDGGGVAPSHFVI